MSVIDEKKEQENELVAAAQAAIEQQANRGGYTSPWQKNLNDTIDKILNREKFSYDMNADAFYQQAKDRYVQQGKQAMMDTIGQQTALTGGYGNSWAQTAGQQAYHGYLQGLNDRLTDFYGIARGAYDAETDDLYNQFNMFNDRDQQDYARYVDDRDYNEQVRQFLAIHPEAIAYYKQLLGEDGTVNLDALAGAAVSGTGSVSGGVNRSSGGSTRGVTVKSYTNGSESGSDKPTERVDSGNTQTKSMFEQATGNKRYDNNGTNFTTAEYQSFVKDVGMNRTENGKATTILDALAEGKITEKQADSLQKTYKLTDEDFEKALGMTAGASQGSYTQVGMTDFMKAQLEKEKKKNGGNNAYKPYVTVR